MIKPIPCQWSLKSDTHPDVALFFIDHAYYKFADGHFVSISGVLVPASDDVVEVQVQVDGVDCLVGLTWHDTPRFEEEFPEATRPVRARFNCLVRIPDNYVNKTCSAEFSAQLRKGNEARAAFVLHLDPKTADVYQEHLLGMRQNFCDAALAPDILKQDSDDGLGCGANILIYTIDQALVTVGGVVETKKMKTVLQTTPFGHNPHWVSGAFIPDDAHALRRVYDDFTFRVTSVDSDHRRDYYYAVNYWDVNYQHFLIETAPKILHLLAAGSPAAYIYVRDFEHIRDFVEVLGKVGRFRFVKDGEVILRDGPLHFLSPVATNFNPLSDFVIESLRQFSKQVAAKALPIKASLKKPSPLLFLGRRDGDPRNQGRGRSIVNKAEVDHVLDRFGGDQVSLEGLTYAEKVSVLSDRHCIVTPIGANLMNVAIAQNISTVIVLCHRVFGAASEQWFETLLKKSVSGIERIIFFKPVEMVGEDRHCPYRVNVDALADLIGSAIEK